MCSTSNDGGSRTILWCLPRTISTALAKCLSHIEGCEVWFELYCYSKAATIEYKYQTKLDLPTDYAENEEIFKKVKAMMDIMAHSPFEADRLPYGSVKSRLEAATAKHVFVKDMCMAMTEGYREYIPKGYRHTFIIRHPDRVLLSYHSMTYKHFSEIGILEGDATNVKKYDIEHDDRFFPPGFFVKELYDLWKHLQDENIEPNPIIIDSEDLLANPAGMISAYCNAVGLPYDDSLLKWDASSEVFQKMKASGDKLIQSMVNYYGTAMNSTCFLPPKKMPSRDELPHDVIRCSDKVMKYYDEMYECRLKL